MYARKHHRYCLLNFYDIPGCLQLEILEMLEIYWNLKTLLEILEISLNLMVLLEILCKMINRIGFRSWEINFLLFGY